MLLLARTTPLEERKNKTDGLTLFYTDFDRSKIEVRLIHKMGRHAVDSNMLFIEDLCIPEADRIGEEGKGFRQILNGMNPERILIAAEAIGIAMWRWRRRRVTPMSGSCSVDRSARIRASSIRSRNAGRSWRPRI
jgi:alkylation response protein AidB-like acyl-CoA dehydrogenase